MRLLDVRHEQTAAFAAEATGKLTRVPGLAVLTAGPGVTNGVSAIAQAQFAGSPMVVVGGRAPAEPLGQRQPPGARPAADRRVGLQAGPHASRPPRDVLAGMDEAFIAGRLARTAARSFVDVPMDEFFNSAVRRRARGPPERGGRARRRRDRPDRRAARRRASGRCWSSAPTSGPTAPRRPRCGSSRRSASRRITNGMGRGVVPGGHPLLVTKARGVALGGADLVVVVGTPLDFRLGYGVFGGKDGRLDARAGRARRRLPRPGVDARRRSPARRPAT